MQSYSKLIQPVNYLEEKEKFFSRNHYNPRFVYFYEDSNFLLKKTHSSKRKLLKLLKKEEYELWGKLSCKKFNCYFDDETLEFALKAIRHRPPIINSDYGGSEDCAKFILDGLGILGIQYGTEIVNYSGFNARPVYKSKKVQINKNAIFEYLTPKGVAVHEIIHIIRYINSQKVGIKSSMYLPTEEGLACYIEDFGTNLKYGSLSYFQHVVDYLGVFISTKAPFVQVYDFFLSVGFSKELSFQRAARCKFGIKDTAMKGSNLRIGMYFYNENLLQKEIGRDSSLILTLLSGRLALNQIKDNLGDYAGYIQKEKLMNFLKWAKE